MVIAQNVTSSLRQKLTVLFTAYKVDVQKGDWDSARVVSEELNSTIREIAKSPNATGLYSALIGYSMPRERNKDSKNPIAFTLIDLLEHGFPARIEGLQRPPFYWSIDHELPDCANALLKHGANPNEPEALALLMHTLKASYATHSPDALRWEGVARKALSCGLNTERESDLHHSLTVAQSAVWNKLSVHLANEHNYTPVKDIQAFTKMLEFLGLQLGANFSKPLPAELARQTLALNLSHNAQTNTFNGSGTLQDLLADTIAFYKRIEKDPEFIASLPLHMAEKSRFDMTKPKDKENIDNAITCLEAMQETVAKIIRLQKRHAVASAGSSRHTNF